jgi:hypothetical protein
MLLVGSTSMPLFSKKGRLKTGQQRLQVGVTQTRRKLHVLTTLGTLGTGTESMAGIQQWVKHHSRGGMSVAACKKDVPVA